MATQAQCLSELLLEMEEVLPECVFWSPAAESARTGRSVHLKIVFPFAIYDKLWQLYQSNHSVFMEEWKSLAREIQLGFIQHAHQRLTALTRPEHSSAGHLPAWKSIQHVSDEGQQALLHTAIVAEVVNLIEPFIACATMLRGWAAQTPDSEKIDRSLEEATRCYFFALFTACAVTCRASLEDGDRRRLPQKLQTLLQSTYLGAATLRHLLHEINDNLFLSKRTPDYDRLAIRINGIGRQAARVALLSEEEAGSCIEKASAGLRMLQLQRL